MEERIVRKGRSQERNKEAGKQKRVDSIVLIMMEEGKLDSIEKYYYKINKNTHRLNQMNKLKSANILLCVFMCACTHIWYNIQ